MIIVSLIVLLLSCVVIPSAEAQAGLTSAERDEKIQREMDCIAQKLEHSSQLDWQDVCYTSEQKAMKKSSAGRDDMVARSLDDAAREHNEYFKNVDANRTFTNEHAQQVENDIGKSIDKMNGDFDASANRPTNLKIKTHQFNFNYDYYYYRYTEDIGVRVSGRWKGFSGAYTYQPKNGDSLYFKEINYFTIKVMKKMQMFLYLF